MTGLAVVAAVGALAGLAGVVAAVGDPIAWASSQVRGGECENDPGRLTDLCANNRLAWWDEAFEIASDSPRRDGRGDVCDRAPAGQGRRDARQRAAQRAAPAPRRPWRRRPGPRARLRGRRGRRVRRGLRLVVGTERPAAAALACLVLAYAVHSLVDYDLDFLAVTAPALVALGALLAVGSVRAIRPCRRAGHGRGRRRSASTASLVLVLPDLADREVERSLDASDAGRIEAAVGAADRARRLNPLSTAPLEALASPRTPREQATAVAWYEEATGSSRTIRTPGTRSASTTRSRLATSAAYQALNHSYTLDPNGRAGCREAR